MNLPSQPYLKYIVGRAALSITTKSVHEEHAGTRNPAADKDGILKASIVFGQRNLNF
jgi:hypothetical protein